MYDITELADRGQCKYPLTDAPPHFFCGEPTVELACSYCLRHAALCYGGAGKNWVALYEMMKAQEQTVVHIVRNRDTTPTVVEALDGAGDTQKSQLVSLATSKQNRAGIAR